jgi:hypothetical protein
MNGRNATVVACVSVAAVAIGVTPAQAQEYDIIQIELPTNLTDDCLECDFSKCKAGDLECLVSRDSWHLRAHAVNRHGEVVGTANLVDVCTRDVAFVWLPKEKYGLAPGTHFLKDHDPDQDPTSELETFAYDINDAGIIVGQVDFCPSCDGMIWDLNEGLAGVPMNSSTDTAWAVNNAIPYEVAGSHSSGSRAFVWHSGTGAFDLYLPQGGWNNVAAFDLSTPQGGGSLTVAGRTGNPEQGMGPCVALSDAVAWSNGAAAILQQPSGFHDRRGNELRGAANGVNDAGVVVGFGRYDDQMGPTHTCLDYALRWADTMSVAVNLGVLATDPIDQSHAHAVNPLGDVTVGTNINAHEAVLWIPDGGTHLYLPLCDLTPDAVCSGTTPPPGIWRLFVASDINTCDAICGWGDRYPIECPDPRTDAYLAVLPPPPCPADIDGDGDVDVGDLVDLLLAWGTSNPMADISNDGIVDVGDLVALLVGWGVCPCNIFAPDPASHLQELQEGGLTWDDWLEFLDNIADENYQCWMAYHLNGGAPNCPGPDPWGN